MSNVLVGLFEFITPMDEKTLSISSSSTTAVKLPCPFAPHCSWCSVRLEFRQALQLVQQHVQAVHHAAGPATPPSPSDPTTPPSHPAPPAALPGPGSPPSYEQAVGPAVSPNASRSAPSQFISFPHRTTPQPTAPPRPAPVCPPQCSHCLPPPPPPAHNYSRYVDPEFQPRERLSPGQTCLCVIVALAISGLLYLVIYSAFG